MYYKTFNIMTSPAWLIVCAFAWYNMSSITLTLRTGLINQWRGAHRYAYAEVN